MAENGGERLILNVVAGRQKGVISDEGSRESRTGRKDFKNRRPGEADSGMLARGPAWTIVLTIVVDMYVEDVMRGDIYLGG